MGLLDRFEQSMERLMEGTVGSVFRQSIQPAEIGKKLERAMLAHQRASVGTTIVPNAYLVRLHPKDYAQFADFTGGLSRQLESWLAQIATQRQFTVLDRITVDIREDETAGRRNPAVDATITDRAPRPATAAPRRPSPPVDATAAFSVAPRSPGVAEISLRVVAGPFAGQVFSIADGTTTIGRSPDNTVVLNAPDVSRRHARLERTGSHLRIYDLNSTNGTRVNGEAVHISDVEPGDEIRLGAQALTVVSSAVAGAQQRQGRW